ncbi:MAG: SCO family protein [Deltaproteobacteria bacterium]|nr:SCO family protein [Deltaproteobacteria bacterium]
MRLVTALALAVWTSACGGEPASPTEAGAATPAPAHARPQATPAPRGALPGDSLYQLGDTWTDQGGEPRQLAELRGHVVVLAMMFTHCTYACPRIVADMRAIEDGLAADTADDVRFVLASYDTKRDTPETLRAFAASKGLNLARWTLLHGDPGAVRELSAAIGGSYTENDLGNFAHTNQVVVLDREGRQVFRQEGLGVAPAGALAAIRQLER